MLEFENDYMSWVPRDVFLKHLEMEKKLEKKEKDGKVQKVTG